MAKTFSDIFRKSPFARLVDRNQILTSKGISLANGEFGTKHSLLDAGRYVRFDKFDYAMTAQPEIVRSPGEVSRYYNWPHLFRSNKKSVEDVQELAKNSFAMDTAYPDGKIPKNLYKFPLLRIPKHKWGQYAIQKDINPSWSSFWKMYMDSVNQNREKTGVICIEKDIQPIARKHPGTFVSFDVPEKTYVKGRYLNSFSSSNAASVGIEGFVGELQELPVNAYLPSRSAWHAFEVNRAYIDPHGRPIILLKRQLTGYIS